MLVESENVRQIAGEPRRRWFSSNYFDLIVWLGERDDIVGFQLCYDIPKVQRVLAWNSGSSYSHHRLDDGENRPGKYKATPILVADGKFEYAKVAGRFKRESKKIDPRIASVLYERIKEYSAGKGR